MMLCETGQGTLIPALSGKPTDGTRGVKGYGVMFVVVGFYMLINLVFDLLTGFCGYL